MTTPPLSTLVEPQHLARKAIIYIRQSSPHQVLTNQESLRLQYALQQRALSLGWRAEAIEVVDADLGVSGTTAQARAGFKDVAAQVALGQVGLILSVEVARLSRNCSDWYPLLDVCAYTHCLIGDRDGLYDPGSVNGRLLLGLKGQLSELELHTIRARLTAGLLNKASRGELALVLPTGLVRDELGRGQKDSNREVQDRIDLVFQSFLRLRTSNKVLRYFNSAGPDGQNLLLPRRDRWGDIQWRKPRIATILSILKNPAYAGAFVYGRSRTTHDVAGKVSTTRLAMDEWRIVVRDVYPAYIDWDTFERIQAMLKDNYAEYDRNQTRGVPRPGKALLHGLVYCGVCGHKMLVQYKGGTRYICNALRQQYQVPVCQYISGDPIDDQVVAAFFQALAPVELDAYTEAMTAQREVQVSLDHAHQQQLERLRYEAALAERQFRRVDPDNRLVAAELERRWEAALRALQQAEDSQAQHTASQAATPPESAPAELREAFAAIGQKLPLIWNQEGLTQPQKKAFLRCLIDKVVIHRSSPHSVHARIVWRGGDTTTLEIPMPVKRWNELPDAAEMETLILELSRAGQTDEAIAAHLTTLGHRSPMCPNHVLPSTVRIVRLQHGLFLKRSQSHPRHISGSLTVPELAQVLDVTVHWLYDRIHNGCIQVSKDATTNLYLFPDTPATRELFEQLRSGRLQNLRFS
jgi:DNA invertase Pin-like site-specific DNA recombinase